MPCPLLLSALGHDCLVLVMVLRFPRSGDHHFTTPRPSVSVVHYPSRQRLTSKVSLGTKYAWKRPQNWQEAACHQFGCRPMQFWTGSTEEVRGDGRSHIDDSGPEAKKQQHGVARGTPLSVNDVSQTLIVEVYPVSTSGVLSVESKEVGNPAMEPLIPADGEAVETVNQPAGAVEKWLRNLQGSASKCLEDALLSGMGNCVDAGVAVDKPLLGGQKRDSNWGVDSADSTGDIAPIDPLIDLKNSLLRVVLAQSGMGKAESQAAAGSPDMG
ncbi:hypothetical protein NDU88_002940 [Pleurodeles waltl]|uniref:Uncharacterized protein n=1 Tax=Pleurodeles waltl TaxID=8319 RepID=A0AAV7T4T7_PLEWA|nr:hypothetical protein NDU88_002940 [Pleurodeles waltl]